MDVGKLIRKLEPLIPEKAGRWRRALDLADPDVRALLEKEIVRTAYRLLGDFRKKPLLSLPPPVKSKGSINLGTIIYEGEKWDFGLTQPELLRNMGIFGMSGSGKTNVAFHILRQLVQKRVHFLFWDWKRTARHLIPSLPGSVGIYTPGRRLSPFPFNPFIVPPGLESNAYVNHVVDVLSDAYSLGDGSRSLMRKAITTCYRTSGPAPSVRDILLEVEKIPDKDRVRGWKISAVRALESLEFAALAGGSTESQEKFARDLLDRSTIIELDALDQGAKKFLVPIMCLWLYYVQLSARVRERLKLVIFVEEAHHVLYRNERRAKEAAMAMLLRQCREIGIGMVVIDQHPHLISSAAIGNAYTTICLNQRDSSDTNKAGAFSLLSDSEKRFLNTLPVGRAIVKLQGRWQKPFLVQVPHVEIRKGAVTDDLLAKFLAGAMTRVGLKRTVDRAFGREPSVFEHRRPLTSDELRLINDVVEHDGDSIRSRYARLGLSGERGNAAKQALVRKGVLAETEVKTGRTWRLLLKVTPAGRASLGLTRASGRGSIQHEYWKRLHALRLRERGYLVVLEQSRGRGYVDLSATRAGERLAVEIETGKSDVVSNVREDLLAGYDTIAVVATDEKAFRRIERILGKAGLLVPGRIHLGLREILSLETAANRGRGSAFGRVRSAN